MINDCAAGTTKGFFDDAVGAQFAKRSEAPTKAAPKKSASARPASPGFFAGAVGAQFAKKSEAPSKAAPTQAASASGNFIAMMLPLQHKHVS